MTENTICNFNYSVVIPFGKTDGNFLRSIKSILIQKILPHSIIIVCNGAISESYVFSLKCQNTFLNNSLIKFTFPQNCSNANIARNYGLDQVSTDWVAFLDSDDWWNQDWIFSVEKEIRNKFADFIYSSIRIHNCDNTSDLICDHYSKHGTPENYLLSYLPAQTSTYIVSTKLAKKVRWNNSIRRHQDFDFFVRLVKLSENVTAITDVFVNVDWSKPRRHKYHLDCLSVIEKWQHNVKKEFFINHLFNLWKNSIASNDWNGFIKLSISIIYFSAIQRQYYLIVN